MSTCICQFDEIVVKVQSWDNGLVVGTGRCLCVSCRSHATDFESGDTTSLHVDSCQTK